MTKLAPSINALSNGLTQAAVEALETMTFISPLPLSAPPLEPPPALRRVCVSFTGPIHGFVELTAARAFGTILASTLSGLDPDDPDIESRADDVLGELANVTCGLLLRRQEGRFKMAPPVVDPQDVTAWPPPVGVIVALDADGHSIVVRLCTMLE
jgi:hypothetical protein